MSQLQFIFHSFQTINTSKRKVSTLIPLSTQPSRLGVIKQSARNRKFLQTLQILSLSQDEHQLRKSMKRNGSYIPIGVIERKVNLVLAPQTVIDDFLIYLFSEKKYQISTIKGYRSMISNTLKFKTGNRIGSNPVLSELQRPVQRSLTPKWDLAWVLVCLQKAPYEPFHKAYKLHVTLKTAFL